jgi:hypothetical protein
VQMPEILSSAIVPEPLTDELSRRLSPEAGACSCCGVADRLPAVYCSSRSSAMAALPVGCCGCGRAGGGGSPHRLKGSSGECCAAVVADGAAADPADAVCWCGVAALLKGSSSTAGSHDKQLCRMCGSCKLQVSKAGHGCVTHLAVLAAEVPCQWSNPVLTSP